MTEFIIEYLPYAISVLTVASMYLVGERPKIGWLTALVNQILWTIWITVSATWGLFPLNVALWVVFLRNYYKAKKTA
jgi:hypothetical protein